MRPQDDDRLRRPAGIRTVRIGELRLSYVPDGATKMIPTSLFPESTDAVWAEHDQYLDDSGWLTISAGGLLVEHGDRAMLIDAGFGPFPEPTSMMEYGVATMYGDALLDNLRRLGRTPESIEAVAISHLHMEHIGWAAHPAPGTAAPVFQHADYLISRTEWDNRHATYGVTEQITEALAPRVRFVADGDEVFPGVRAMSLPGHTAGQVGFTVASGGTRLIAFADVLHSPVQVANPDWPILGEPDPGKSAELRRRILGRLADEQSIGFGIHFADVPFGTVHRTDQAFAWKPLP